MKQSAHARRRTAAAFIALIALNAAAIPVLAHAELVSSEPAAGATVPAGLTAITLTFSEPLTAVSQAVVFAGQFQPVSGLGSTVDGPVLNVKLESPLGEGIYTVQWMATGTDGHPLEGSYQFAVSPSIGAGQGPTIALASSLIIGVLALAATVLLARRRRH